jgi:hypothetical protein
MQTQTIREKDGKVVWKHTYTIDGADAKFESQKVTAQEHADEVAAVVARMGNGRKSTLIEKAKGAVSIAKAELAPVRVPLDVLFDRQGKCEPCENNDLGKCLGMTGCGCYLWPKIREPKAKCPIGKWDALTI